MWTCNDETHGMTKFPLPIIIIEARIHDINTRALTEHDPQIISYMNEDDF